MTSLAPGFKPGPPLPMDADLSKVAKERGIEYFLVAFVDIKGVLRSKMVPAPAIGQIQKDGAGFAPFAAWLDYGPDASDMVAIPDPTTLIQLPFQPELAFVIGDCYIEGEKVQDSPRWVLKNQIEKAKALGYVFKTGVEPEFFLLSQAENLAISDPSDRQEKPCYDAQSLIRRYDVLKAIVSSLNACGFGVYQTDHEDANGQFEINWHYSDCLTTADRLVFFKWVVKMIAERHGFRATFMPRPFKNLSGNGLHAHCSLWQEGTNVFVGTEEKGRKYSLGLSPLAMHFLGGVMEKAATMCAITNPTVNSYKRINGAMTLSGATWAPNRISFSGNNRTHMVRVPANDRFEVRLADGAANPYLLPAAILAAGIHGMEKKLDPSACFFDASVNMYLKSDDECKDIKKLPLNLLDALRVLEKDPDVETLLGSKFVKAFLKLKYAEWHDFTAHLSRWELEQSLDC